MLVPCTNADEAMIVNDMLFGAVTLGTRSGYGDAPCVTTTPGVVVDKVADTCVAIYPPTFRRLIVRFAVSPRSTTPLPLPALSSITSDANSIRAGVAEGANETAV